MNPKDFEPLALGSVLVQQLIRVGAPYRMVDRVEAFATSPKLALRACRHVTANEPVFAGHYEFLPVLPGTLILEGMSQTAGILSALTVLQRQAVNRGVSPSEPIEKLRNLELGFRLDAGHRPGFGDDLLGYLSAHRPEFLGMLAASSVKFRKPVFPGECLTFTATLVRELESLWHFEVEATAGGQLVADGTVTNAVIPVRIPSAEKNA